MYNLVVLEIPLCQELRFLLNVLKVLSKVYFKLAKWLLRRKIVIIKIEQTAPFSFSLLIIYLVI